MTFNPRNWSVREAIQKRVQIEDLAQWGKSRNQPQRPAVKPVASLKPNVGLLILFKNFVYQFRP